MRTVLTVDPSADAGGFRLNVKVEKHFAEFANMSTSLPLELLPADLPQWDGVNAVIARGQQLRAALRKHIGVAAVLDSLAATPANEVRPIYVKFNPGDAELITWETLCDQKDAFVALDSRWPIGRITDPAHTFAQSMPVFQMPVKVLAVISALNTNSQDTEWERLRDEVIDARQNGLPIALRVLVGDAKLYDAIQVEIDEGLADTELGPVADTSTQFLAEMLKWQPNVLHFFCHGESTEDLQSIAFATRFDFDNKAKQKSSIVIDVDELRSWGQKLQNPWLLTLNCCSGGKGDSDLPSIAFKVVSAAFPAAIAMLEPIDERDAHEFSRAMYRSLFAQFVNVMNALTLKPRVEFEWALIMHEARAAINSLHGKKSRSMHEWALPALYVRGVAPMSFEQPVPGVSTDLSAKFKDKVTLAAEWARTVGATMDDVQRQSVIALLLKDVPAPYWYTPDGVLTA